jgi:hypothetical protein
MKGMLLMAAVTLVWLFTPAKVTWACEANVPCESVVAIDVGKGRRHLPGGKAEMRYVASVVVDATKSNLKEVLVNCPQQTWGQAKRKLMAICADKIPPIPRRVLEHRPRE